ncbi:MAG: HAMP domain-containing histidine kinase [Clostridia bacterium]|nr:HAMP domain-containing histidine kinase [Clostridia bacterium]
MKELFFKGITKRWLLKCLSKIVLILVVVEVILTFLIQIISYNNIKNLVISKAESLSSSLSEVPQDEFDEKVTDYVVLFQDKNFLNVIAFDKNDKMILSNCDKYLSNDNMQDYNEAKSNSDYIAYTSGKDENNQDVFVLTKAIFDKDDNFLGAVRYIVSLKNIDRTISISIITSIVVCLIMILFIILSSMFFFKSISKPIKEVSNTSRKIALGDLSARLTTRYDDEIGELCDTVNFMGQKLSESEKMKNEFISSISHELRTPLTAIKGWAETIQMCENKDDEMYEKGINIIIHESERLSDMVEELLDFAKIQSSQMILKLDKIDILAELSEAVYMFRKRANEENKILLYSEPENLPPVLGDKNRLKQVFINIVDNALKYTPENGVVNVSAKAENNFIVITISDNGCGIPNEHLPKVKEKFYKANTEQKGSGIGLALANDIILLHEGTLEIKSEENIGTVVTITIPIAPLNN